MGLTKAEERLHGHYLQTVECHQNMLMLIERELQIATQTGRRKIVIYDTLNPKVSQVLLEHGYKIKTNYIYDVNLTTISF